MRGEQTKGEGEEEGRKERRNEDVVALYGIGWWECQRLGNYGGGDENYSEGEPMFYRRDLPGAFWK